ncbi:MAG: aldo/keto reductase [Alphaproteobacteria bacterium]|nr:aldo/keto reductase [Alphaproteobacteria bacterium]
MSGHADTSRAILALGTAQIGLPYGLAAVEHDEASAFALLDAAAALGIRHLDTAAAYGESERRIGAWLTSGTEVQRSFRIVSKLAPPPAGFTARDHVRTELSASCRRLGVAALEGYMVHGAREGVRREIFDALACFRNERRVEWIGASVYTPAEADAVMVAGRYDVIQLPLSLANRAAATAGTIERVKAKSAEIHVRSVFIQGLLLRAPHDLPSHLSPAAKTLRRLDALARDIGCERAALALASVLQTQGVDRIVIGADGPEQLNTLVGAATRARALEREAVREAEAIAASLPGEIADPRRWPK